ncbi:hypothetical protein [Streptomyces fungicidicus]|uniref:hypothetical protein n=1 Tax=Streptomyces fungicidicus TaxID=68203 RepID=UPI003F4D039F
MNGAGAGGTGRDDGPVAPTACGGGASPGNGGTGPPDEVAGAGEAPEAPGESGASEEEDGASGSELPEAFCVYQAGGA